MKSRLPEGFNKGPGNMQSMIKQAQKMQAEMEAKQAELDQKEYEIQAGGGAVTVTINGKKEIQSIRISPEVVDPDDIETLSDILVAAVNQAIKKVESVNEEAMTEITGGMNVPGMSGLF
ncbi:MAG: YbaB/EbfC family nucleoid-associated protein [Eubacteriales bacterium]